MPHLRLEYTENIVFNGKLDDLFSDLHHALAESGNIDINNCKSRAVQLQDFLSGDGSGKKSFLHLEVSLYAGRTPDILKQIGEHLKAILIQHFKPQTGAENIQITIEIREFKKDHYFKYS